MENKEKVLFRLNAVGYNKEDVHKYLSRQNKIFEKSQAENLERIMQLETELNDVQKQKVDLEMKVTELELKNTNLSAAIKSMANSDTKADDGVKSEEIHEETISGDRELFPEFEIEFPDQKDSEPTFPAPQKNRKRRFKGVQK